MRRWQRIGFAVFCLLAGSRWLVANAWPSTLPSLLGKSFHFLIGAVVALVFRLPSRRLVSKNWWRIALAGLLLFGLPALCAELAGSQAEPALFTLLPLFVIVGGAAMAEVSRSLMMPALVGAAGGLLVLPFALPTTIAGVTGMSIALVAVGMVAAGSVWLHTLLRQEAPAAGVWLVCGVNAVVLGLAGVCLEGARVSGVEWMGESARVLIVDVPEVFLLLWLLRAVRPEQVAALAFFVQLVTVVEGLVLLRPGLDLRMAFGLALMVAGGCALLFRRVGDEAAAALGLMG